jgi:integrase
MLQIAIPGARECEKRVAWDMSPPSDARITNRQFDGLIAAAKQFVCSMVHDPPHGRARWGQSSLLARMLMLRALIGWMAVDGTPSFRSIDRACVDRLRAWIASRAGRRGGLQASSILRYLMMLQDLYRQRAKLEDALTLPPFLRESVSDAAGFCYSGTPGIPYIPDAVAVHLLSQALAWVETHSVTILTAESLMLSARAQRAHRSFKTAVRGGCRELREAGLCSPDGKPLTRSRAVWRAVALLTDACFIVIGGFVGMRVSEILSLRAGAVEYVGTEDSSTRQAYLTGTLSKTSSNLRGRSERWLAPPAVVQAIRVLEQLTERVRRKTGRSELFLVERAKAEGGVRLPSRSTTLNWMNRFASHVGVPLHEGVPWKFSSHQLRKTFARFIAKRDRSQLMGLADHFKHVSVAMTSRYYVGNDFELGELIDEENRAETVLALERMLTSDKLGGRLGERIKARGAYFRGRAGEQVRRDYIEFVMTETDLRVHACDYGWCVFQAETARCGGVIAPTEAARSPRACLSCANMVVQEQHLPYWKDRRARNAALLPAASLMTRAVLKQAINECDRVLVSLGAAVGDGANIDGAPGLGDGASISGRAGSSRPGRGKTPKARGQSRAHHARRSRA